MAHRPISIANVSPDHPRGSVPSTVEVLIDLGLKTGKLAVENMTAQRAVELASKLLQAALIVQRVNDEKRSR